VNPPIKEKKASKEMEATKTCALFIIKKKIGSI
jgi:hypothetical protein